MRFRLSMLVLCSPCVNTKGAGFWTALGENTATHLVLQLDRVRQHGPTLKAHRDTFPSFLSGPSRAEVGDRCLPASNELPHQ